MDQSALTSFEYFGDYRPYQNQAELPCHSGLLFSGWVNHASNDEAELSSRIWRVQIGDLNAELFCDSTIGTFLSNCLMDGLDCWVTGFLVFAPTVSFCPLVFSVYSMRGRAPRLSDKVAQCLATSAVLSAIRDVFENPVPHHTTTSMGPSLCHPVAYSVLMQKTARLHLAPEVLRAVFFIVHSEACTMARTSIFYGQDATRLGTSSFTYRGGQGHGAVQRSVPPTIFPGEVVRGCAVVSQASSDLFAVLAALLEVDASSPTLVLSERAAVPFLEEALRRSAASATNLLTLKDFDVTSFAAGNVVIVSMEMLCHDETEPHMLALRSRPWFRLVTVGWPQVSQELSMTSLSFNYQTHLCLSIAEDLHLYESLFDTETVAALLGVSEAALQEPLAVSALLRQRIFHMSPFAENGTLGTLSRPRLCYSMQQAPPMDNEEAAKLANFRGAKRQMRMLFGGLCASGKGRFAMLPEGVSALDYFASLHIRISPFAQVQLTQGDVEAECPVCFEPNPPVLTSCGHRYCQQCLQQSLLTQRRCPACRAPLQVRDIVNTEGRPEEVGIYLDYVATLLQRKPAGRALVLASWGEVHERLASALRRKNLPNVWAWRGGAKQLCVTLQRFRNSSDASLLVDPGSDAFALAWACFEGVKHVYALWPLNAADGHDDICCQLRRAKAAAPGARFVFVTRERGAAPQSLPTCTRPHVPGLECPSCIFDGRLLELGA